MLKTGSGPRVLTFLTFLVISVIPAKTPLFLPFRLPENKVKTLGYSPREEAKPLRNTTILTVISCQKGASTPGFKPVSEESVKRGETQE